VSNDRRHHTPEEEVTILRQHFIDRVAVSTLYDEHQLHPTVFYRWLKLVTEAFAPLAIVCGFCCVHRIYFWDARAIAACPCQELRRNANGAYLRATDFIER
jgi:hypothetical protein